MTKEDIICMALEAGFARFPDNWGEAWWQADSAAELERFAALIASRVAAASASVEREACAKVCDDKSIHCEKKAQEAIEAGEYDEVSAIRSTAWQISVCAAAIRARGQV